jgi:sugar O-acyltransferase (sialic acid O-acetyltransferase NeuD family)
MINFILLGAGGHAKALADAITVNGGSIKAYVDPKTSDWLDARHETKEENVEPSDGSVVIGLGGLSPIKLQARLSMLDRFLERGFSAEPIIHPSAYVSPQATLEPGTVILGNAIIQPDARIERGAIVNTSATIEHDSTVGAGAHIAPGAIVLGDCQIGKCGFIGAGTVILQGRTTPDAHFIAALSCYDGA